MTVGRAATLALVTSVLLVATACSSSSPPSPPPSSPSVPSSPPPSSSPMATESPTPSSLPTVTLPPRPSPTSARSSTPRPPARATGYPWHTGIVATTFWVGEIFDPDAEDGSQVTSTYDGEWLAHYGGCDGIVSGDECSTEKRTAANGYFPSSMTPKENPFYLDLPFDDVNDSAAFARRGSVIPWAKDKRYAGNVHNDRVSLMKNRWVELRKGGRTCFAQIEDAGPGQYNDADYVFGTDDARPENTRYGGAGADVSPAVNGCLGFSEIDGDNDKVDWRFVEAAAVPKGPWKRIVTTSGITW